MKMPEWFKKKKRLPGAGYAKVKIRLDLAMVRDVAKARAAMDFGIKNPYIQKNEFRDGFCYVMVIEEPK